MKITVDFWLVRSISAFFLGTILILWTGDAIHYLVLSIGILFIILGFIPMIMYLTRKRETHPDLAFPYAGLCCLIFGLALVIAPPLFVNVLMYLLGIILVVGGIGQIFTLIGARKWTTVPVAFYAMPALIVFIGILVLINPFKAAETLLIFTGISCLIYGIAEFVNWLKFRR